MPEQALADIQILPAASGGRSEVLIQRVVRLDFDVRVELTLSDGRDICVQLPRESAEELELAEGQILPVRLPAERRDLTS